MTAAASASKGDSPASPHRTRSQGRELALRYLFSADLSGLDAVESFDSFAAQEEMRGNAVVFARELVAGVLDNLSEIDATLERFARNWKLSRMAAVDRNVLRVGTHELLREIETPVAVLINEAVELAKRYGSDRSGGFVNGLMDRIAKSDEVRAARAKPDSDPGADPQPNS